MSASELCSQSIAGLQGLLSAGSASREEVLRAHLARIDEVNPIVNGFVELRRDQALTEAKAADRRFGRAMSGPLDGVPTSMKDTVAVAALATTNGVKSMSQMHAAEDSPIAARMKNAGALIMGHSNVPDFLIRWNTVSDLYGPTRNPRDARRTAGGSSGGEAANVAAGMAVIGLGGDFGGSIRVPASFCGVYGLRTSPGVVPQVSFPWQAPTPALDQMATAGPFARNVADLDVALQAIAGRHPADPQSVPVRLERSSTKPPIAVLRDETGALVEPGVESNLVRTIEGLRALGIDVAEGTLPRLERAPEVWAAIVTTDLEMAMPRIAPMMGESGRQHIEQLCHLFSLGSDLARYAAAWIERRELLQTLAIAMEEFPVIVAPAAGITTPFLDFDEGLDLDATRDLFDHMRCIHWVNLFGLPALTLPNGIQLVGRRFTERDLLAIAQALEPMLGQVEIADGTGPEHT